MTGGSGSILGRRLGCPLRDVRRLLRKWDSIIECGILFVKPSCLQEEVNVVYSYLWRKSVIP
jgi:hypothetical protein